MDNKPIKDRNLQSVVRGSPGAVERMRGIKAYLRESATVTNCLASGYAPLGYALADFSIVEKNGVFHLFHIPRVPGGNPVSPAHEHWFGHAASEDLETWVTKDPVLYASPSISYESSHVWAPFVFDAADKVRMIYTALSGEPSQVLCAAVARDESLAIWDRSSSNPIIPWQGFDWHWRNDEGHCRHARDPHVVQVGKDFLLLYTTMHRDGCPAVGGLFSRDLEVWEDLGPVYFRPMPPGNWWPESVNVQQLPNGRWVMFISASPGIEYLLSDDPFHWHNCDAKRMQIKNSAGLTPEAPEILRRSDRAGRWLVAYFTGETNRLMIGEMDITTDPFTLRRLDRADEVQALLSAR